MNQWYTEAERNVDQAIRELEYLLPRDGEDISCYNPSHMDSILENVIKAKANMAIGKIILEKNNE